MKGPRGLIIQAGWMALLILCTAGGAAAQTNEQIVDQFFPQSLIDISLEDFQQGGPEPFRSSGFAVGDLDGNGSTYIVAAYSNGSAGVVRVLQKRGGTFYLVDEPNLPGLGGNLPEVKLLDLDNDGRPEVIASFTSSRGPTGDWLFKWDGTRLNLIGPTEVDADGVIHTLLSNAAFIDTDGDGILEIVKPKRTAPLGADETQLSALLGFDVYRFDGVRYGLSGALSFVGSFLRRTGAPVLEKSEFEVENPGAGFNLTIVNGRHDGKNRVSSAVIKLNGVTVAGPSDFSQQVGKIVRQASLLADNMLEVEVRGAPGGELLITIGPPPS